MEPQKVCRHPIRFYGTVIITAIFCLGLALAICILVYRFAQDRALVPKDYLLLLFVPILSALGIYGAVGYFKAVPVIRFGQEEISFNKKRYRWMEIDRVELMAKCPIKVLGFTQYMHGAAFYSNDGAVHYAYDMYYLNIDKLKRYVAEKLYNVRTDTSIVKVTRADVKYEFFDTYDGYLFFSMRGIFFCIFLAFFLGSIGKDALMETVSLFAIVVLFSWLLHCFKVSDYYLVVQNHTYLWPPKRYRLSDIREVSFDTYGKMPNFLRVVTRDFKYRMFPAGTLREHDWREMKAKLESNGVIVKDYIGVGSIIS